MVNAGRLECNFQKLGTGPYSATPSLSSNLTSVSPDIHHSVPTGSSAPQPLIQLSDRHRPRCRFRLPPWSPVLLHRQARSTLKTADFWAHSPRAIFHIRGDKRPVSALSQAWKCDLAHFEDLLGWRVGPGRGLLSIALYSDAPYKRHTASGRLDPSRTDCSLASLRTNTRPRLTTPTPAPGLAQPDRLHSHSTQVRPQSSCMKFHIGKDESSMFLVPLLTITGQEVQHDALPKPPTRLRENNGALATDRQMADEGEDDVTRHIASTLWAINLIQANETRDRTSDETPNRERTRAD